MTASRDDQDYVWHFKLSEGEEVLQGDALTGMVRRQLEALLGCVRLTCRGRDLDVTGFRFLDDGGREYAIYPPPPDPLVFDTEPTDT